MSGYDTRMAEDIWRKLAESEARIHLMMELGDLKVGFPDVEEFCLDLERKYRATATGDLRDRGEKSPEWQVVKVCMQLKMIDEKKVSNDLLGSKYRMMREIEDEHVNNSRKRRNIVRNLRKEAAKAKKEAMKKYESKMKHLRKKYRDNEEEKLKKVPEAMEGLGLEGLTIFDKNFFEAVQIWDYEVEIIGDLELSENEKLILKLPPKFAVEENLPEDGLSLDGELSFAKARMTIAKEEEEKLEDIDE